MFLWAWGINGCFSVIGAAAVPLIATAFGLSAVLMVAGGAYLLAIPALLRGAAAADRQVERAGGAAARLKRPLRRYGDPVAASSRRSRARGSHRCAFHVNFARPMCDQR